MTAPDLHQRALARIPGGVNSPVRAFGGVGGQPFFVARAEGAFLYDTDGRRYTDFVQSWGASILGHADPGVIEAVTRAAGRGTSYGAPTEAEVLLAEEICRRAPGVDKLRLLSSGTESTMTAVRLARGFTGRDLLLKFAGGYHGHADSLLASAGSGAATLGLPGSAGVPSSAVADTLVVAYNDEVALDEVLARFGPRLAAVIVEGVPANAGVIPPQAGFLAGLRRRCDQSGALLIVDEVITGFRLGDAGAQGHYGVTADLSCFGKVVGGGIPLAALGGRLEVMDHLAPLGPVYQAGTLSGNPLATAAGLAVLGRLDAGVYAALEERAVTLANGLGRAFAAAGVRVRIPRVGPLLGLFFSDVPVTDYAGAKATDAKRYAAFFHAMLARGFYFAPSAYEAIFVALAHTPADIQATVTAAGEAAREIASQRF
jgi:glutamate-1-semialdehyde 2,1-aminomutase